MNRRMNQLNSLESMFVYLDQHGAGMAQLMLQVFSSRPRPNIEKRYGQIVARIRKAVPHIRLMHEKIHRVPGDTDKPYWVVEKHIDLDYHIRHLALPPPGNWDQLTELYEQLAALPLDLEMPLWRVYIVEGLNRIEGLAKDSFAVITKTHHAGADGVTVTQLTNVIAGATMSTPAARDDEGAYVPGIHEVIGKAVVNHLDSSLKIGREFLLALPTIGKWALKSLANSVYYRGKQKETLTIPDTRFNGRISPDRVFDIAVFKRAEINALRHKLEEKVTINDVGLAICGGALREYLQMKKELPRDPLVAGMPISIRTDEVGGNQFSVARIPLYTNIKSPLERLRRIHADTSNSKQFVKSVGEKRLKELANIIPGSLLSLLISNAVKYRLTARMPPLVNCMATGVPGSPKKISFDGNDLVYMHGSPPLVEGLGLIFGVFGYDENIQISLTSCRRMVPDKKVLMDCLDRAFAELKKEVGKAGSRGRRPARGSGAGPSGPASGRGKTPRKAVGAVRARVQRG